MRSGHRFLPSVGADRQHNGFEGKVQRSAHTGEVFELSSSLDEDLAPIPSYLVLIIALYLVS